MTAEVSDSILLARLLGGVLRGHEPQVMGAALCDCTSMWLAGHYKMAETDPGLYERLLETHIKMIRRMLPIQVGILRDRETRG